MNQELIGLANPQAETAKLHRIIAYVTSENHAAQRVAASQPFEFPAWESLKVYSVE